MKKIALFTQNLGVGGVQKLVSILMKGLNKHYSVVLIFAEEDHNPFYNIPIKVKTYSLKHKEIHSINKNTGKELFSHRTKELTQVLNKEKPDIVISFEDYHNLISLNSSFTCKKIVVTVSTIKNTYSKTVHFLSSEFYYEKIKTYYPQAFKVISVSNVISKELKDLFNLNSITIHNGIDMELLQKQGDEKVVYKKYILSVGRLHTQKGHIDLLKAFKMITNKIEHNLLIIGEGKEKENLINYVKKEKLTNRVIFHGSDNNPYKYIKNADLFIFPSLYEGHPFTLIEAMFFNTPIIAYNFNGLNEIFTNKDNTCTIGDIKCLSTKIFTYLINNTIREENIKQMNKLSLQYSINNTLNNYFKIIENEQIILT